jgi:hypothetical protein
MFVRVQVLALILMLVSGSVLRAEDRGWLGKFAPDVSPDHWAFESYQRMAPWLDHIGGKFQGTKLLTRYALAYGLGHMTASDGRQDTTEVPFEDVPRDHWANIWIGVCIEEGVFPVFGNKFRGRRLINRYQLASILENILSPTEAPLEELQDVPPESRYYPGVQIAISHNVLETYEGKFHGNKLLNRYQFAIILDRLDQARRAEFPEILKEDLSSQEQEFDERKSTSSDKN